MAQPENEPDYWRASRPEARKIALAVTGSAGMREHMLAAAEAKERLAALTAGGNQRFFAMTLKIRPKRDFRARRPGCRVVARKPANLGGMTNNRRGFSSRPMGCFLNRNANLCRAA